MRAAVSDWTASSWRSPASRRRSSSWAVISWPSRAALALHPFQVGHVNGHADHAGDPAVGVEQGPVVDVEDDVADRALGPQLLAAQQPLEVGGRLRLVAAQLHERAPDPLRGGDAELLERSALGQAADAVGVVGGQHDRCAGDDRTQPGLAGPQPPGRPVVLGEVLDLAEEAQVAPVRVVQQGRADEQVEAGPVGPQAAPLDLEGRLAALAGRGPAEVGQDRVVPWLGQVADGAVQQLGLGTAEELAQGAVDAQEAAVQADQRHPDGGLDETEAEVHLAPLASPHSDEWVVHRV
jgi:hypothetical protein